MLEQQLAQLNLKAGEDATIRLVEYCRDVGEIIGGVSPRPPDRNDIGGALGDLVAEGRRLNAVTGDGLEYTSNSNGRHFSFVVPEEDRAAFVTERRYDIVTLGGWTMTVANHTPAWQTVNDFFHEQNHIFDSYLTAAEVKMGSWTWGGHGDSVNHFSIAAILHGTRDQIPQYDDLWWNEAVSRDILFARAVGENQTGEPITLTLTIGQIGG